jgi:hypothetical protein
MIHSLTLGAFIASAADHPYPNLSPSRGKEQDHADTFIMWQKTQGSSPENKRRIEPNLNSTGFFNHFQTILINIPRKLRLDSSRATVPRVPPTRLPDVCLLARAW